MFDHVLFSEFDFYIQRGFFWRSMLQHGMFKIREIAVTTPCCLALLGVHCIHVQRQLQGKACGVKASATFGGGAWSRKPGGGVVAGNEPRKHYQSFIPFTTSCKPVFLYRCSRVSSKEAIYLTTGSLSGMYMEFKAAVGSFDIRERFKNLVRIQIQPAPPCSGAFSDDP